MSMAPGIFRGGPLDGQRRPVPEHGPAYVRFFDGPVTHWYTHKRGTKRTYQYLGQN